VLQRLRKAGLKLKPEKCSLLQKSVSFLGHSISDMGIGTDKRKTQTVVDWPVPSCIKEARSFVSLCSHYRRFVKNFAAIAAPIHDVIKSKGPFKWTPRAQESLESLKIALTTPPILAMPIDTGEFTLDTDSSDHTIAAVLSQKQHGEERVIAYASRLLDKRERNYCITRKELLAVVHYLKVFKQYLLGRHFRVRTDHVPLSWHRKTPDPIGQQGRWLEILEEYDFYVEHRAAERHLNADALTRQKCQKKECLCKMSERLDNSETTCKQLDTEPASIGGPADQTHCANTTLVLKRVYPPIFRTVNCSNCHPTFLKTPS
jgi:hypothetical protein